MARYVVGLAASSMWSASFPFGTMIVNVAGCACIGFAAAALDRPASMSQDTWALVVVGFLGGFTTFSAFGLETVSLLERHGRLALANVVLQLVLGLGAVLAGRAIGHFVLSSTAR
jgi:CrcB protein